MGTIPGLASTRGLKSSAFDAHQKQMKQLLPKDLVPSAVKVPPDKIEAEVRAVLKNASQVPIDRSSPFYLPTPVPTVSAIAELKRQAATFPGVKWSD